MAFLRAASEVLAIYTLVFTIFSPAVLEAQSLSLAPAPAPAPSSDDVGVERRSRSPRIIFGTSIDQGIAYVLMVVALVLTYLIHPFDASSHHF